MEATQLKHIARQIRASVLHSIASAGSGHTGGSLGLTDVFSVLYFNILNHDPQNATWQDRDRLVLSIGHVAPVLYATLAHAGYFPVEELTSLRKLNTRLQGHPARNHGLPGIELAAGSLGQGLSVATGMALSAKHQQAPWKTYCILGDGELQEGSVWEAAMSAAHYKLDNLIAIVDRNGVQIDGKTEDVMALEPLTNKWQSFGWHVLQCNGNNVEDLQRCFTEAQKVREKPAVLLAHTKMGAGIKSIEDDYKWHGKAPDENELQHFLSELEHA